MQKYTRKKLKILKKFVINAVALKKKGQYTRVKYQKYKNNDKFIL